jgi:hypothetical protein
MLHFWYPCHMLPVELWEQVVNLGRGRRGRDRMVVGFTTTCPISVYDH